LHDAEQYCAVFPAEEEFEGQYGGSRPGSNSNVESGSIRTIAKKNVIESIYILLKNSNEFR
jgi:hypothetical protein